MMIAKNMFLLVEVKVKKNILFIIEIGIDFIDLKKKYTPIINYIS